jgi:hypothetical protein
MAHTFAGTANEIPEYTAPINAHTGLPDTLTDPVGEYDDTVGTATIGGFVSRQASTNSLWGKYVFGDYQSPLRSGSGLLLYIDTNEVKDPAAPYTVRRLAISGAGSALPNASLLSFGEGPNGAVYSMWDNGQIYELQPMAIPLPGDYNNNHVVDAADYALWRDNVGTTNVLLNDAIGGTIGQAQYDQWQANFGKSIASGGAGIVPEPQTLLLVFAAAGLIWQCQHQRTVRIG